MTAFAALVWVLSRIDMISGAGMLDFLACHSVEKLVLDAEAIEMAKRFVRGIEPAGESLAADLFSRIGLSGEFLKLKETRALFRNEQYLPGAVIDRGSLRQWEDSGREDAFARARRRVADLVAAYRRPELGPDRERALLDVVQREAARAGLPALPGI